MKNAVILTFVLSCILYVQYFDTAYGGDFFYDKTHPHMNSEHEDHIIDEILSWNIGEQNHIQFSDSLGVAPGMVGNSLRFDGKSSFLSANSGINSTVTKFSILLFVEPDFNKNKMTIIEQENLFNISLENIDGFHAKFSVFDGEQWVSVSSPVNTKEKLTRIFVEFDGSSIKLLVNDKNLVEKQIFNIPSFAGFKYMIDSEGKILVGGSKSDSGLSDFYSGNIDEVQILTTTAASHSFGETVPSNQTSVVPSNQTSVVPSNQTSVVPSNQTSVTSVEPVIRSALIEDIRPDDLQSEVLGKLKIENNSEVVFDGSQMIDKDGNSTKKLLQFTISSWVNPDYEKGSDDFTIISKEATFGLGIHNTIQPSHTAWFAVFDGIKWNIISSSTKIPEEWTNISATYDGSLIHLYINGKLENTMTISIPYFTIYGKLLEIPLESLDSDSDLTVGALHQHHKNIHQVSDLYSGKIDSILLLNSTLTDNQIHSAYIQDLPKYQHVENELTIEEITKIIQQEQLQNQETSESLTNETNTNSAITTSIQNTQVNTTIEFAHDAIEIGKPVVWTQNITFSNSSNSLAVELPNDAVISEIKTKDKGKEKTLLQERQDKSKDIVTNNDIKEKNLDNLEIVNSNSVSATITNSTIQIESETIPLASLDKIPEMIHEDKPKKVLLINDTADEVSLKFETPAPYKLESDLSTKDMFEKKVTIAQNSTLHYTDVKSHSDIPESLVSKGVEFKLYWMVDGVKTDVTHDPAFHVEFVDTDENGIDDQMQWIVPRLSTQEFVIEGIIIVTKAEHLDGNRQYISDIYDSVKDLDGVWSETISDSHYVRVTFEMNLVSQNDITLYPKVISGSPRIEIYEKDGTQKIAEFTELNSNQYNKVLLTSLQGTQNTFDLLILGGDVQFDHIVDPMPAPTFVAAGNIAANANAITPALPAGIQANDILILFLETGNEAISIAAPGSAGTWTEVTGSPQGTGTTDTTGDGTRLTIFWARYPGTGTTGPTTTDSGDHQVGRIIAIRGAATSGNPIDITGFGVNDVAGTTATIPGNATTVPNTYVLTATAVSLPDTTATNRFSGWTNADLSSITELIDNESNVGHGGGIGVAGGVKTAAGTYTSTTVTLVDSAKQAMISLAIKPIDDPPTLSISQPDGISDTVQSGANYNITYSLNDYEETVTSAFYYDNNNSGLDGAAISGACATAAEGTSATCSWDTTGMANGKYYVYGITNDGVNSAVSTYSSGTITIANVYSITLTETLTPSDSISKSSISSKTLTELLSTSDAVSRTPIFTRSLSDTLSTSDAVSIELLPTRTLTDTLTLSDALTARTIVLTNSLADNLGLSESLSLTQTFGTTSSEIISQATQESTSKSSGGGGKTGVRIPGASIKGTPGMPGFELSMSTKLEIAMVSYDKCEQNLVRVFVLSDGISIPTVQLRGSTSTVTEANLVSQSISSAIESKVFEYVAPISSDAQFFMVTAQTSTSGINTSVATLIDVSGCKHVLMFQPSIPNLPSPDESSSVEIFDLKINLGDGAKRASDTSYSYSNNQPLQVSAIVSSPTVLKMAEIRFVTIDDQEYSLHAENMTITDTGLPDLYLVSGEIPNDMMSPPAMLYWVRAMNQDTVIHDSEKFSIGVKPSELIPDDVNLDSKQNVMSGTDFYPTVLFDNKDLGPLYGYAKVTINGTTIFQSEPELYSPGINDIPFTWHVFYVNEPTKYLIKSQIFAYDQIFEHDEFVDVFPSNKIIPTGTVNVSTLRDSTGNEVAKPFLLYSSLGDIEGDYRIQAPDGTCVIGTLESCIINSNTSKQYDESITIHGKEHHIRYSGAKDSYERFSITSDDLMEGNWIVKIVSERDGSVLDDLGELKISYKSVR